LDGKYEGRRKIVTKPLDLIGKKFGRLTVLERKENNIHNQTRWLCQCDCGNRLVVSGYCLTTNNTKSCGCLQKDIASNTNTKHGHCKGGSLSKTYVIWAGIKDRCYCSGCKSYEHYGGRGIKMCDRWFDFNNFIEDMGEAPVGMSIDRINVNGNYEPNNCKWATSEEQHNNIRSNVFIKYNGEIKTLTQWAKMSGVSVGTFKGRYYRGDRGERLFRKVSS
jgi:hypothetical protein